MRNLIYALVIWIIVYILHISGIENGWYLTFNFYDILTHGLGGVGIGFLMIFISQKILPVDISLPKRLIFVLLMALAVGLVWEVFEYAYDIAVIPRQDYVSDTLMDLFMDISGSVVAFWLAYKNK